jgi:hypothetical protein
MTEALNTLPEKLVNELPREERETSINWTADERIAGKVRISTNDPIEYALLLRRGHIPKWTDGESALFDIDYRFITIRSDQANVDVNDDEEDGLSGPDGNEA